jgi:hypothetical protein
MAYISILDFRFRITTNSQIQDLSSSVFRKSKRKEHSGNRELDDFLSYEFSPSFLLLTAFCSLSSDHLIRSREHVRRDRQPDLLRGLEIDDKLKLCRLLHRQVGGICAF